MTMIKSRDARETTQTSPEQRLRAYGIWLALAGIGLLAALVILAPWALEARASASRVRYTTGQTQGASPRTSYDLNRQAAYSPDPGSTNTFLYGVAVANPNDVWAVGYASGPSAIQTVIEHWNGSVWSVVPSPNPSSTQNELYGVAVTNANDVWAVGDYASSFGHFQTLIAHWNGSVWSVVPSPNPSSTSSILAAAAVTSANDIWAVGNYTDDSANDLTLIAHWNGSVWSVVPSPNLSPIGNDLYGVAVASANDVWTVGLADGHAGGAQTLTLSEHWDGTTWSVVNNPSPGSYSNGLGQVAVASANEVWATGGYSNDGIHEFAMMERWNGSVWSAVNSPYPAYNVAVVSGNDVWAVGSHVQSGTSTTFTEQWNGTAWSMVASPSPGLYDNNLFGLAVASANDIWTVGDYSDSGSGYQTLIEHWNGTAWSVVPSPGSATATPTGSSTPRHTSTPTRTSTPPTGATATPTTCRGFTDVPVGSTFYPFITCLVGRGIVSGYPDCTFHVNSNVTRGQLSKIVSLAANFNDPPGNQVFQDIPPLSTFYNFVQRLANRNIIGGYACGGAGEPCVPPANRPYFRPNSNATRGQISKIVSNAANFGDPPGAQIFQDIAPGSTFYDYVQRLANRNIAGGYACGGPAEPCVPPANRPYFRPNANATRGQVSKIVVNAFFPNCQSPPANK